MIFKIKWWSLKNASWIMAHTKKTFITYAVEYIKTHFLSGEIYVTKEVFMKAYKKVPNLKSL